MKNKIYILSSLLLLINIAVFSQAPSWQWAKSAGGADFESGYGITTDGIGNSYASGTFNSDSITFGSYTLVNAGISNIFIVKYDPSGNVVWAKSDGGNGDPTGWSVKADANGNLYVGGWFDSDSITLGNTTLFNAGIEDIFIAKYDASGNLIWAKSAGGTDVDYFDGLTVDNNGNSYITGGFNSPSITFGSTTLTNTGIFDDVYIVKYDAAGNVQWAKSAAGASSDEGYSVTAGFNGYVYITGIFYSNTITFGSTILTNVNGSAFDLFIAKYDDAGNVIWAKSAGGTGIDFAYSIAVDMSGDAYITGRFDSPSLTFGSTTLTNSNNMDEVFIAKFDASGNAVWANSAGGTGDERGMSIALDTNKNSYITGAYNSPVIQFNTSALTNAGSNDIFIVKYDVSGNEVWAKSTGGTGGEGSYGITVDASGNSYLTGFFISSTISFDGISLTNSGNSDVFVAKLNNITGISEQNNSFNAINIFPNPVSDELNITTPTNSLSEIILYDIASRKLLQQQFTNTVTLNTAQLAKGMYIYEVRNSKGVMGKGKVVKE